jgi:hypothetical protein
MSNRRKPQNGEGRDRPYSAEWRAGVKAEATAFLIKVRARDAAARAARDKAKTEQRSNRDVRDGHSGPR